MTESGRKGGGGGEKKTHLLQKNKKKSSRKGKETRRSTIRGKERLCEGKSNSLKKKRTWSVERTSSERDPIPSIIREKKKALSCKKGALIFIPENCRYRN